LYKYYNEQNINDGKNKKKIQKMKLAKGFELYDLNKPALHEAGFDSYLTSWVFLHLPLRESF
jgi:hypothetical protein